MYIYICIYISRLASILKIAIMVLGIYLGTWTPRARKDQFDCFYKLGVFIVAVLVTRALLLGVYIWAPKKQQFELSEYLDLKSTQNNGLCTEVLGKGPLFSAF